MALPAANMQRVLRLFFVETFFFELVKPPEVCYRKPKHCLNPMVYGDTSISGKMPQGLKKLVNGCQRFIAVIIPSKDCLEHYPSQTNLCK